MWQRPFLKSRYRAILGKKDEGNHWLGGPPLHQGATCPTCDIPLLVLWDINCQDSRFKRKFGELKRLPLHFCWGCVNPLSYRVVSPDRVHILTTRATGHAPSFPYDPYPPYFERRPLTLAEGTPNEVRRILNEWDSKDYLGQNVPENKKEVLGQYFGHPVSWTHCWHHHQLGGWPLQRNWGDWTEGVLPCPNPDCPGSLLGRLFGRRRNMMFLAGVLNDPWGGLPMVERAKEETRKHWNYDVSVHYHICDRCLTVHGCNVAG